MSGSKRERQKARRQAQQAAARAAARRRARRRRLMIAAVLVATAFAIGLIVALVGDDGDEEVAATDTTTTVAAAAASAAGEPCVPVADPLPEGAPAVPVQVGPPPTELVKEDLREGTGETVSPGATVTVNYIGVACSTGKIFDSSYSRNQPATFSLNGVIRGWQEGIPGMKVGGQRLLGIPADQAYGPSARPPDIRPDEALWFVVEVVDTRAA